MKVIGFGWNISRGCWRRWLKGFYQRELEEKSLQAEWEYPKRKLAKVFLNNIKCIMVGLYKIKSKKKLEKNGRDRARKRKIGKTEGQKKKMERKQDQKKIKKK